MTRILLTLLMGFLSFLFSGCDKQRQQAVNQNTQSVSQITWFEIERSPHEFRIGIGPDKPALLAYKPDGSDRCQTSVLLPESNKENFVLIFRSLDALLTKLDIMNLPQHEPEKFSLTGAAREEPAIYVRFVRGNETWQSRFTTNEIPPKIQELYSGCRDLAVEVCERSSKKQLSPQEALDLKDKRIGK